MEGNPVRQPISELNQSEVDKIAAGEVVERPLNVVKELIENALDAGASEITVELEDGGKQLIRVSDNGSGIPAAELPLAVRPHHTSKIRSLEDIYHLSTMGFRGEALASISAVSRLKLTSRLSGEPVGAMLEIDGGEMNAAGPAATQPGTEVEVRELFYNTPVRLKFLRSKQSETAMVSRIITSYALAFPEVAWRLSSSGRTLIDTGKSSDLRGAVRALLGSELADAMHPVDYEFPPYGAGGLVSAPHQFLHNRSRQWFFINRRPVVNKSLYKAVDDAVREFVSPGKHPAGIFLLDIPPEEIDVNVHPMKTEVSFSQPRAVYSLLSTAVRRALGDASRSRQQQLAQGLSRVLRPAEQFEAAPAPPQPGPDRGQPAAGFSWNQLRLIEGSRSAADTAGLPGPDARPTAWTAAPDTGLDPAHDPATGPPADIRIAQVAGSYLVAITPDAVWLIDQHEAHERILFETLYFDLRQARGDSRPAQRLLFNLQVQLAPAERDTADEYLPELRAAGFEAALAGGGCLEISAIPAVLAGRVDPALVHGMLEDLAAQTDSSVLAERLKAVASVIACRSAVKGNDQLTPAERLDLVRRLLEAGSSLSCPHGSPTVIRLGVEELRRMFIR